MVHIQHVSFEHLDSDLPSSQLEELRVKTLHDGRRSYSEHELHIINGKLPEGGILRHAICQVEECELEACTESKQISVKVSYKDSRAFFVASCANRHRKCYAVYNAGELRISTRQIPQAATIDFSIIRTCRNLHQVGSKVLYTTNTFSFDDPMSCGRFLSGLTQEQKGLLRSVHINRPVVPEPYKQAIHFAWSLALNASVIKSLTGLWNLNLCVEQDLLFRQLATLAGSQERLKCQSASFAMNITPMLGFCMLPLRKATVVFYDELKPSMNLSRSEDWERYINRHRWTVDQKKKTAELFRTMLLHPKSTISDQAASGESSQQNDVQR